VTPARIAAAAIAASAASASASPSDDPPALTFGARLAAQAVFLEGDGPPSDLRGYMLGVDASYRIAPRAAIAAVVEGATYLQRSDRLPPGGTADTLAVFAELQLDTAPRERWSARIELATGYRWLSLPLASGPTDRFGAWEALRLRVGPAWHASPRLQVAVLAGFGFGFLVARDRAGACSVNATCADSLYDSATQSSAHFTADLALVVRGGP
jgi:hypothetical protein